MGGLFDVVRTALENVSLDLLALVKDHAGMPCKAGDDARYG
jgi:hypothetical protein